MDWFGSDVWIGRCVVISYTCARLGGGCAIPVAHCCTLVVCCAWFRFDVLFVPSVVRDFGSSVRCFRDFVGALAILGDLAVSSWDWFLVLIYDSELVISGSDRGPYGMWWWCHGCYVRWSVLIWFLILFCLLFPMMFIYRDRMYPTMLFIATGW